MPRDINGTMQTAMLTNGIRPVFLAQITFKSQTMYMCTLPAQSSITLGVNTYLGLGNVVSIGQVTEATDVQAYGLTVSLSGIDGTLLNESLTDIQQGAPASLLFALLDSSGNVYGSPVTWFSGTVDKASIHMGTDSTTISLQLENRLADLQRASNRRYTSADQQHYYPGDTIFAFVESLNNIALIWNP